MTRLLYSVITTSLLLAVLPDASPVLAAPPAQQVPGPSKGQVGRVYDFSLFTVPGQVPIDQGGISSTMGINDRGVIVGDYVKEVNGELADIGYIYDRGQVTDVDVPGYLAVNLLGVNNQGATVGIAVDDDFNLHALVRDPKGHIRILPDAADGEGRFTQPSSITENGVIIGTCGSITSPISGFIFENDRYTYYQHPGALETYFWGGNNRGDVTGFWLPSQGDYQAFIRRRDGTLIPITPPEAGASRVLPRPINDAGLVAGTYRFAGVTMNFLYDLKTGAFSRLAVPDGIAFSIYGGINNFGTIVGLNVDFTQGIVATPR